MNFKSMKRAALASVLAFTVNTYAQDKKEETKEEPKAVIKKEDLQNEMKTVSFAHGHYIGSQMKAQKEFIVLEEFIKGLKAALADEKNPISQADFQAAIKKLEPLMKAAHERQQAAAHAEQMKKMAEEKKKNIGHITKFLEEKLEKTASGLEYKVVKAGSGDKPKATDSVTVHYTGYLTDGSKFDSSVDRGEPATFPLNRVIKGWTEGLQLMSIGAKYRFKIPSELGYGAAGGGGGAIPPNATLIFDVELISIAK